MSLSRLLWFAGLIITLAMGIRHSFGLFVPDMSAVLGGGRGIFALALAVQNLLWGLAQPFAGAWADRVGARRVLVLGTLCYVAGLLLMATAAAPLSSGALVGLGLAGTTYGVVFGVVGKVAPPEKRTQAMGITAAAGSVGQFIMLPLGQWSIDTLGWSLTLIVFSALVAAIMPLAVPLRAPVSVRPSQPVGAALKEACRHPGFLLLCASYGVCGFQVTFVGVHLPAYLADQGIAPQVGATALALIGLFNIVGTWLFGLLGARRNKARLLSLIYAARALAITCFVLLPLSPLSSMLFAAAIGFLWLGTVPLTNGLIAGVFGVEYLSMLGGVVFMAHQVGSFFGVWLGGLLFDRTGSYGLVWWMSVVLGVAAAFLCLPIREERVPRLAVAGAAA